MADYLREIARNLLATREHLGHSLDDVASALGMDSSRLEAVENGSNSLTGGELLRLARFYDVHVGDLIQGRVPSSDVRASFRAHHVDAPAPDADLAGSLGRRIEILSRVRAMTGQAIASTLPSITISGSTSWQEGVFQGREAARRLRAEWGLGAEPFDGIVDFLRDQGLFVVEYRLPSEVSGASLQLSNGAKAIIMAYKERSDRQRFTAAHELGHLLLDADTPVTISHEDNDSFSWRRKPLKEVRADAFASELLLPFAAMEEFAAAHHKNLAEFEWDDVARLAMQFQVSFACAMYQLLQHGVFDEAAYQDILETKKPNANAWRDRERLFLPATLVRQELDAMIRAALEKGRQDGQLTSRRVMEYAADVGLDGPGIIAEAELKESLNE